MFFVYHLFVYQLSKRGYYHWIVKYITMTINISIITLIIIGYAFKKGPLHTVRTVTVSTYFFALILSSCYYKISVTVYTGILTILQYSIIYIFVYFLPETLHSTSETFNQPALSADILILFCTITILLVFIVILNSIRFKMVLDRSLYSEALSEELKKAKEAVEAAIEQKTSFFINVVHESKTPLTLIKNHLEDYIQYHSQNQDLEIIKNNVNKLLRDMTNYLDVEKMQHTNFIFNHDAVICLSDFLEEKYRLFKKMADIKEIDLQKNIGENIFIKADPSALDRIINNLLENALKYTDRFGIIHLKLSKTNDEIQLIIQDTGPGIAEDLKKNIFIPYFQVSHQKKNNQGIGMGLYIVKKAIDSLGGLIQLKSKMGTGSQFTVKLPLFKDIDSKNVQKNIIETIHPVKIISEHFTIKDGPYEQGKNNLLIVDDNIDMLNSLRSHLKAQYNLFFAVNGTDALHKINIIPKPELIISDIMMDHMDGITLFTKISQIENFQDIPFIFLTARTSLDDKIKAVSNGAVDYIYKPFSFTELKTKIYAILRNRELQKKLHEKKSYESIGVLLAGISHEIFNPLSGIHGPLDNLENLLIKYNLSDN
ncbi:MAG: response regulator, partial [Spirochaetes bacterium]|nr:response regulator [Spirochaetota bacterium]